MKVFLVCLLACVITTTIGVLALSLVYVNNPAVVRETGVKDDGTSSPKPEEQSVDVRFQFLNRLGKSKVSGSASARIFWHGIERLSASWDEGTANGVKPPELWRFCSGVFGGLEQTLNILCLLNRSLYRK